MLHWLATDWTYFWKGSKIFKGKQGNFHLLARRKLSRLAPCKSDAIFVARSYKLLTTYITCDQHVVYIITWRSGIWRNKNCEDWEYFDAIPTHHRTTKVEVLLTSGETQWSSTIHAFWENGSSVLSSFIVLWQESQAIDLELLVVSLFCEAVDFSFQGVLFTVDWFSLARPVYLPRGWWPSSIQFIQWTQDSSQVSLVLVCGLMKVDQNRTDLTKSDYIRLIAWSGHCLLFDRPQTTHDRRWLFENSRGKQSVWFHWKRCLSVLTIYS